MHAAPASGASELLRQAYDIVFTEQGDVVPLYFALSPQDRTSKTLAQQFLHMVLQQYIAFRRNQPSLSYAVVSLSDLVEHSLPQDAEWIERSLASADRERSSGSDTSHFRACLNVLTRIRDTGLKPLLMLDGLQFTDEFLGDVHIANEFSRGAVSSGGGYVFSGIRRELTDQFNGYSEIINSATSLHLDLLNADDSRALVERAARRFGVTIVDQTRDLLAQQFGGSPLFITVFLQSAAERGVVLSAFRDCQRLYIDELMGGRLGRYFSSVMERVVPGPAHRQGLLRLLFESRLTDSGRVAVAVLRRRLDLEASTADRIVRKLNAYELATLSASFLELHNGFIPWIDYLHAQYRLEVAGEPRALVFADALLDALKRAPQTMARHYRREAALGLRETLSRFNCQRVPASLLHYDRFKENLKGATDEEIAASLDSEAELIRLPQVVHVASCEDFDYSFHQYCDEERCAVAHCFEAGSYSDANEVIWIVAEIESKLEAGKGLCEIWCERLQRLARSCGFSKVKFWLVSPEGFSDDAVLLLNERGAYHSSRQQFELLSARLSLDGAKRPESAGDEFEMVIPMGEDSELIAANTVEQIARRINFEPEAINQIKTALVEACINAAEHSLSPDRKIYQRFRVENDKLVVTVSSRGVVPGISNGTRNTSVNEAAGEAEVSKGRRGWGLRLIQSLMDEVEFETVDDGTRLRMTKYLRKA
jgi:serine/threonine-protein kinase RsbW